MGGHSLWLRPSDFIRFILSILFILSTSGFPLRFLPRHSTPGLRRYPLDKT